ncbi:MAG: Gfo/Idh/MocA family oxidoreductase [Anaerolineales bacterium]|nr:Gfo/Idh/MocA family oxidoreductase [Anaerolineales bacterium]
MTKVQWGILGTAKIIKKIIPAFQRSALGEVIAIASRSEEKARNAAETYGLPQYFSSYKALLADPCVDAIYIPLPNHLHLPWSLKAIQAGKHVLCEKPVGLNTEEAELLLTTARANPGLKVMEAFMYRFHPQWKLARQWVDEGKIGDLCSVHTFISYYKDDPDNIRNVAAYGGGGMMDIGCYAISFARFLFNCEPWRVFAAADLDPHFSVDRMAAGVMEFGRGLATFTIGTQMVRFQRVQILGSTGRIELEIPVNAPADEPCRLNLQNDVQVESHTVEICDQYTIQCDLFSRAVLEDTPVPTPLEDAVANMRVIDRMKLSMKAGAWA